MQHWVHDGIVIRVIELFIIAERVIMKQEDFFV